MVVYFVNFVYFRFAFLDGEGRVFVFFEFFLFGERGVEPLDGFFDYVFQGGDLGFVEPFVFFFQLRGLSLEGFDGLNGFVYVFGS